MEKLAVTLLFLCACRASVDGPDMTVGDLGSDDGALDLAPPDLIGVDLACSVIGPEICNNGCDDDRNGFTDADDPACAVELLTTQKVGAAVQLGRLSISGTPTWTGLAGGTFNGQGAGTYVGALATAIFYASESLQRVYRVDTVDGGTTAYNALIGSPLSARDVCAFNGELILVERAGSGFSKLERLAPDLSEKGQVTLSVAGPATACASDGTLLWVAISEAVSGIPGPTHFYAYDTSFNVVAGPVFIPPKLSAAGYDRVLDFARAEKDGILYGLFINSGGSLNDANLFASQVIPFGFDGGSSPPIDAGTLHSLGEFAP